MLRNRGPAEKSAFAHTSTNPQVAAALPAEEIRCFPPLARVVAMDGCCVAAGPACGEMQLLAPIDEACHSAHAAEAQPSQQRRAGSGNSTVTSGAPGQGLRDRHGAGRINGASATLWQNCRNVANVSRAFRREQNLQNCKNFGVANVNSVSRALRREQNSLFNCLNSILADRAFVHEIRGLYPGVPLLANLRCGLWYCDTEDGSCYFKVGMSGVKSTTTEVW